MAGFHCFKNGEAYMDIRLLSIFKVEYQSGAVIVTSETVTFFNDMCVMAPAALIDKRIKWFALCLIYLLHAVNANVLII